MTKALIILIIIYIVFLLAVALYVGINVYHILRFRLRDKDDKSLLSLTIYLLLIGVILFISITGAMIARFL